MVNTKIIGNKIAEARKKVNISQAQLAQRLFISSQAVGKWERGESMPDIITFNRLAEILGVDLNYFSDGFNSENQTIKKVEQSDNFLAEPTPEKQSSKLNWDMSRGNWMDADFSGLKNLHEKFSSSNMQRCKFNGSDLSGLLLKSNNVENCDFSGSDISNSRVQASNLRKNIYKETSMRGTIFSESNMERCDFSGADLNGSTFLRSNIYACDLSGTDFTGVSIKSGGFSGEKSGDVMKNAIVGAIWNRTSFINTHLADIVLTGNMEECYFENCDFTRVIFRKATLVNTFFKNNKKMKRIEFIDCTADRLTLEFLKQGKANMEGISLSPPIL